MHAYSRKFCRVVPDVMRHRERLHSSARSNRQVAFRNLSLASWWGRPQASGPNSTFWHVWLFSSEINCRHERAHSDPIRGNRHEPFQSPLIVTAYSDKYAQPAYSGRFAVEARIQEEQVRSRQVTYMKLTESDNGSATWLGRPPERRRAAGCVGAAHDPARLHTPSYPGFPWQQAAVAGIWQHSSVSAAAVDRL
jgi:hypothetical protein